LSEKYDLKQSEGAIGQLYPILEAKDGEIIDGFHREEVDKNWKRLRLKHVNSQEKKLIARLVANFHRRQVSREEKEEWINGLARIYTKQGLRVSGRRPGSGGAPPNEIEQEIVKKTGLTSYTVRQYLSDEFKQRLPSNIQDIQGPRKPASEVITSITGDRDYGKKLVERHREEVLAVEKPKIEREVKQKLLKDSDFQRQILDELRKPRFIEPSEACPSGVCELPPVVESGPPVDVRAESIERFFHENLKCLCKGCVHYQKCGVIY